MIRHIRITALAATLALVLALPAAAFDWKAQDMASLRGDMSAFVEQFRDNARGTRAGRMVRRFERRLTRLDRKDSTAWIGATLEFTDRLLAKYPPMVDDGGREAMIRRDIFRLMDYPLHVDNYSENVPENEKAAFDSASGKYTSDARDRALAFITGPAPEAGTLAFCKVYNCGFVVRTSERTFLVDVRWDGSADDAAILAGHSDAFFLTHPHGDHFSPVMLQAMENAGKPIILPCSTLRSYPAASPVVIDRDVTEPMDIAGVSVLSIFGHQGADIPNNVYHLSFDGWTMIFQGDNRAWEKQAALADYPAADVIVAPVWTDIKLLFDPALRAEGASENKPVYVTAHENELNHTVEHRESYWELFNRGDRLGDPEYDYPPFCILGIGETFALTK